MGRLCWPTQHPGRVQLPRDSGARKLSRCKEAMARVFAVRAQITGSIRVSRYNFTGEQVASQGTLSFIGSSGAVWVCLVLQICLKSRNGLQKP